MITNAKQARELSEDASFLKLMRKLEAKILDGHRCDYVNFYEGDYVWLYEPNATRLKEAGFRLFLPKDQPYGKNITNHGFREWAIGWTDKEPPSYLFLDKPFTEL